MPLWLDRLRFRSMLKGYPPLLFPHHGETHALSVDQLTQNVMYLEQVAPRRVEALRGLLLAIGSPLPDGVPDEAALTLIEFNIWRFLASQTTAKELAALGKLAAQGDHNAGPMHELFYSPLAGPATAGAVIVDFGLLIGTVFQKRELATYWQPLLKDERGRSVKGWSGYGDPELCFKNGGSVPMFCNPGSWLLELNSILGGSLGFVMVGNLFIWARSLAPDHFSSDGGYAVAANTPWFDCKPAVLKLLPHEAVIQAEAFKDYAAFWHDRSPVLVPYKEPMPPKPFMWPKKWTPSKSDPEFMLGYFFPDLSGFEFWDGTDKEELFNQKLRDMQPERVAAISKLLVQLGLAPQPRAADWDKIGDWLLKTVKLNPKAKALDLEDVDEDPLSYNLFRPADYVLLLDLTLLLSSQVTALTKGQLIEGGYITTMDNDWTRSLVTFAPVRRVVLDSVPKDYVMDAIAVPLVQAVITYAFQKALEDLGSEEAEDWGAQNGAPMLLGDVFRRIEDLSQMPWEPSDNYQLTSLDMTR